MKYIIASQVFVRQWYSSVLGITIARSLMEVSKRNSLGGTGENTKTNLTIPAMTDDFA